MGRQVQNGQAPDEPVLVHDSLASGVQARGIALDGTVYVREGQPERQHVFITERGVPGARGLRRTFGGSVSWSPDAASVAFLKNEGTGQGNSLIIKNVATGSERQFNRPSRLGGWQVRWSRDGQSILVVVRDAGLHVFDVQSGQFRAIPGVEGRVRAPVADFSPNRGRTIYVASRPLGSGAAMGAPFTELVAVDVATGAERTLVVLGAWGMVGMWGAPPAIAVDPDGQSVVLQLGSANPPVVTARLALVRH